MIVVNGKEYPLWAQFVERKSEWIGGEMVDHGDSIDRSAGRIGAAECPMRTKITDITLIPNGDDSAFFSVHGEDFDCGFDVQHGGIESDGSGGISYHGYGGHKWRIHKPNKQV